MHFDIPTSLSHLPLDERGYPIPYFVSRYKGKIDFRMLNTHKQEEMIEKKICSICGKKLYKDYFYFISGPIGLKNQVCSDPAMHRECAEFSLKACPHMYFEKATRRDAGIDDDLVQPWHVLTKPQQLFLVKSSKFKWENAPNLGRLIRFNVVATEEYIYIDGRLTKKPV